MPPLEILKAFVLNMALFAAAIVAYILLAGQWADGASPAVVALLVVASVILTTMRIRNLIPITRAVRFTNRAHFLKTLDAALRTRDQWALLDEAEDSVRYTAPINVGLYTARAALTVTLSGYEALLAGPPRVVNHLVRVLGVMGTAYEIGQASE